MNQEHQHIKIAEPATEPKGNEIFCGARSKCGNGSGLSSDGSSFNRYF
jgi:hypothetical protein